MPSKDDIKPQRKSKLSYSYVCWFGIEIDAQTLRKTENTNVTLQFWDHDMVGLKWHAMDQYPKCYVLTAQSLLMYTPPEVLQSERKEEDRREQG